jgi:hypothetical protein
MGQRRGTGFSRVKMPYAATKSHAMTEESTRLSRFQERFVDLIGSRNSVARNNYARVSLGLYASIPLP